jgi:hypothetical protein
MILAEVQLEDPSNGYAPEYQSHRPAGAILVDLAVLPEHAATVRSRYLPVKFAPFSGHDPLVWSEPGDDIDLQRALAFRRALSRYDKEQRIRQSQCQIPGPENELISNWFSKRMTELEGRLKAIQMSSEKQSLSKSKRSFKDRFKSTLPLSPAVSQGFAASVS